MIFITLSGIAIGIAIVGQLFIHTRTISPHIMRACHIMHAITLTISTATITTALAHLGEPQACWLVVDLLGVAIDACTP